MRPPPSNAAPDAGELPPALTEERRALAGTTLAALLKADPLRFEQLSFAWDGILVDLSKERMTARTLSRLCDHARERNLEAWIAALLAGEKVNVSERRAALHTALRSPGESPLVVDGRDVAADIRATRQRMRALVAAIVGGTRRGATGERFRAAVNLGIGGSDLGARLACDALPRGAAERTIPVHFVSNVDPEHLARALAPLDPATTLFVVTSKTFATRETLANAHAAREWLARALGDKLALAPHFVAVTGNDAAARGFGVTGDDVLPLPDFVGGRFSLWSAAGLPIALAAGDAAFDAMSAGAAAVDAHFASAPFERNLPVLLGLCGYWNARHLGHRERIVVPYSQPLALLPAYLQQLVLESNGKRVTREGAPLAARTAPALFGGTGTDVQHAFFQWLHQGTHDATVEFIVPVGGASADDPRHRELVANAIAQSQALAIGRGGDALRDALRATGLSGEELEAAYARRECPGDHASTTILLPTLDARRLGQLLALYEHRTFVESVLFGINAFDQYGVEIGKLLAVPIVAALAGEAPLPAQTDASTRGLVDFIRGGGGSAR